MMLIVYHFAEKLMNKNITCGTQIRSYRDGDVPPLYHTNAGRIFNFRSLLVAMSGLNRLNALSRRRVCTTRGACTTRKYLLSPDFDGLRDLSVVSTAEVYAYFHGGKVVLD